MSETIKIKYKDLTAQSAFFAAFTRVAGCTFGGRQDQALVPLTRRIIRAQEEYQALRSKAFKEHGKLDRKTGAYAETHQEDKEYQEFETLMDGYAELEADLKIAEPIKVKKRKAHGFTPIEAALVSEVIQVEYDQADEGEYLDKQAG